MPLDENDIKQLQELFGGMLKANNEDLSKQFVTADSVTKIVQQGLDGLKLDEKLEGLKSKTEGDASTAKSKKGDEPDADARFRAMQAQIDEEKRKREAAEESARQQRLDGELRAALDEAGVPAARHAHAIAYLRTSTTADGKSILDFDEGGKPVWRAQRNGYTDALDLKKGASEWAGTDDGKHFLPATNVQGTGEGGGKPPTIPRTQGGTVDWDALRGTLAKGIHEAEVSN